MNKKAWLDYLFYDIRKQQYDFRLSSLIKDKEGNPLSSKWKKYSELIFPLDYNESWKIEHINNREILPCEVVIDLENKENIKEIIKKLKGDELPFHIFDTHSRGYHIHIFFGQSLTNEEKLKITKRYGGDEQKSYQGTSIALELAKHWKSGKIKEEIKWK